MTIDLKQISMMLGSVVGIITALFFLTRPAMEEYIEERIEAHVTHKNFQRDQKDMAKAAADKVFADFLESKTFEEKLDNFLEENNSNSVSLRHLLAIKMDMPEEDVADAIADMYNKDKKRLFNVLKLINKEFPEANIWQIEE